MKRCGLLLILMVVSQSAMAWGEQGHRVVAGIAQKRLAQTSPAALNRARKLLRADNQDKKCRPNDPARSFADVANNPDGFRQIELALVTRDWHFVNIDIAHETYDQDRDCSNGDCVVRRIDRMVEILRDRDRADCDRESALIYLIHFMGDLHQPFHTGFGRLKNGDPDRGGNLVELTFNGQDTNLHGVWDYGILEQKNRTDAQWVTRLTTTVLNGRDPKKLAAGSADEWVDESHELARKFHTQNKPFNADYVKEATPVIEERMLLAGLRLARLIEEALK